LNSADPGVEEGGPQTLGDRGVGGATAATAVAVVAIILLLAGLLLLLRALLGQLLSWREFLPTGGGGRRRRLLRGVEDGGGGGSGLQPLSSLLDFLQAKVVEHLLERWEVCCVRDDVTKVFEVLVQPT
jgi:hypothetical protein